jgi:hypothetical protein
MSENNKVDVGGLTGTLFADAWKALRGTVALKISWCKQKGMPLSELQQEQLVESAVAAGASLEAKFARQLVDALNRQSVATWRLDPDLEAGRQGAGHGHSRSVSGSFPRAACARIRGRDKHDRHRCLRG